MRGTLTRSGLSLALVRRWKTILAIIFDTGWRILLFVGRFGWPQVRRPFQSV
jgi:hypothetical protein